MSLMLPIAPSKTWTENLYNKYKDYIKAAWCFDRSLTYDDSKNGHTLTNPTGNAKQGVGINNYAVTFDGGDSHLEAAHSVDFDFVDKFTLSCWYKAKTTPSSDVNFLMHHMPSSPYTGWLFYHQGTTNKIKWRYYTDVAIHAEMDMTSNSTMPVDTFVHIVVTSDGSTVKLYMDNVLEDSVSFTQCYDANVSLRIGASGGSWPTADSQVDEVLIFKGVGMTAEEVSEMYNKGLGRYYRKKFNISKWDPTYISDCVLYLDARHITGLSENDEVTVWNDESDSAVNATQSINNKYPLYKSTYINGEPGVWLDGIDDYMKIGDTMSRLNRTIITLTKRDSISEMFVEMGPYDNVLHPGVMPAISNINTMGITFLGYGSVYTSSSVSAQNISIRCYRIGLTNINFRYNGTNIEDISHSYANDTTPREFWLGAWGNTRPDASYSHGAFGIVLVYDRILTDNEIIKIENYINSAYNIGI